MKKIIAKSAMALAIAAVSTGAFAGTTTAVTKYFAQDIFGDGNSAVNGSTLSSNDTLIATPTATYRIAAANDHSIGTAADVATVKFTLGGSAVFGEDLSDISKWTASTANATFRFAPATNDGAAVIGANFSTQTDGGAAVDTGTGDADYTITVDSGGAIGDNTVVFKITSVGGSAISDALYDVVLTQVKVKNLATTLGAGKTSATSSKVALGAEFQVVLGGDAGLTDTANAVDILASKPVLVVTGTATTDAQRPLIQVASAEKKFTLAKGNAARTDYDAGTAVTFIDLGDLQVSRATYDTNGLGAMGPVNKENGLAFDYQGSDVVKLKLSSASGWAAYSNVWLATAGCNAAPTGLSGASTGTDLTIPLTGQTTQQLEDGYTLCAVANTTTAIPETSQITAVATADFFNSRYMDDVSAEKDYGRIGRNGCSITLFNLPKVSAEDDAFIRLTNISNVAGSVRATVYNEAGTKSDTDVQVIASIPAHGTQVLHTAEGQASGTYLGDVLPGFKASTGRSRIILTGAFPACEALGLVRTPAGVLSNMTSTTYSGDVSSTDANGTSNTKN